MPTTNGRTIIHSFMHRENQMNPFSNAMHIIRSEKSNERRETNEKNKTQKQSGFRIARNYDKPYDRNVVFKMRILGTY